MWSVCEVESIEGILIAVLLLLPARSIFRFRCVSKRWNSIILTPFFLQSYYSLKKASTPQMIAYIRESYAETDSENFFRRRSESVTVGRVPRGPRIIDISTLCGNDFVNSSGGLILLQIGPCRYRVVNPLTNRSVQLARLLPPKFYQHSAVALVYEENMNELAPCYKVVVFGKDKESSNLIIQTFCSKTDEWTTSTPIFTGKLKDELRRFSSNPFVVDSIIHWFTRRRLYLVVLDLKTSISSLGSNSTSKIQLVELPHDCRKNYCLKVVRSSRDDDLWLCMHMPESCYIKIWMMRRDEYDSYKVRAMNVPSNAWNLMQEITYPSARPPTSGKIEEEEETTFRKWVYDIRSGGPYPCKAPYLAFVQESYVGLHIWNLADMSFELVPPTLIQPHFLTSRCDYFPCMEALSLSSYAL